MEGAAPTRSNFGEQVHQEPGEPGASSDDYDDDDHMLPG